MDTLEDRRASTTPSLIFSDFCPHPQLPSLPTLLLHSGFSFLSRHTSSVGSHLSSILLSPVISLSSIVSACYPNVVLQLDCTSPPFIMKFNAVSAALGAALLAGSAVADEAQKVVKDESSSAESSSTSPQLPTFTVQFFFFPPPYSSSPSASCNPNRGRLVPGRAAEKYGPHTLVPDAELLLLTGRSAAHQVEGGLPGAVHG